MLLGGWGGFGGVGITASERLSGRGVRKESLEEEVKALGC